MKCLSPASARRDAFRKSRLAGGFFFAACLCATVTGCARDAVGPVEVAALLPAASTRSITAQCPAAPDFVVSTEAELRSAVANAPAGSTIAISGTIAVSWGAIIIYQSDLRLTCAAPGAGLEGHSTQKPWRLLRIHAPRVSVTGLRLDGQNVTYEAVWVASEPGRATAEDVTLADNDMTCTARRCATFTGTPRAMIVRNRMAPAAGVTTGADVHVESLIGGATSEDVTLADNDLTCASDNCVSLHGTPGAVIARNRIAPRVGGTTYHAIIVVRMGTTVSADVTFADNRLTCGSEGCATLLGTPRALIVRNQMIIGSGVAPARTFDVQGVVDSGTKLEYGAEDVTFADNEIACNSGSCVFFGGTKRALITGNRVTAAGAHSGIRVQGPNTAGWWGNTDGTRVERNTIATAPSTNIGGIRVRDGAGIVVADNVVTGPWQNSVFITAVLGGEVTRNELRGAVRYGILFGSDIGSAAMPLVDGLAVRNNRVTDAGAGAGVRFSCRNVFVGNNLNGNSVGAEFFAESGANTLVGNGTIVVDNGAMDCDDDGKVDPNVITGAKRAQKGLPAGPGIGGAVSGAVSDMR